MHRPVPTHSVSATSALLKLIKSLFPFLIAHCPSNQSGNPFGFAFRKYLQFDDFTLQPSLPLPPESPAPPPLVWIGAVASSLIRPSVPSLTPSLNILLQIYPTALQSRQLLAASRILQTSSHLSAFALASPSAWDADASESLMAQQSSMLCT